MGRSVRSASRSWLIAAAMFAGAVALRAQQTAQPAPFKSATDIVEVDAIVEDGRGAFVDDLSVDDFEIREDGHRQEITAFYLLSSTRSAPFTATGAREKSPAAADQPGHPPSTFIVVFDTDHLTLGDFKRVQTAASTFLKQQFHDGDVGGVLLNAVMAGNRLTSKREELLAAVQQAKPPVQSARRVLMMREWPRLLSETEAIQISNDDADAFKGAVDRACVDEPSECLPAQRAGGVVPGGELAAAARGRVEALVRGKARQLADEVRVSADRSARVLDSLFSGLARIDGRKNVILLSNGFFSDYSSLSVRDIVERAVRANARVYSLDARGIGGPNASRDLTEGHSGTAADQYAETLGAFDMASDAPNSLAVDTGGFVVRNANVFDAALARIARDAGNYYVLGYRRTAQPDGKFHRIEVAVKRAGVHVRARRGYMASPTLSAERSVKTLAEPSSDPSAVNDWLLGLPASWPPPPAAIGQPQLAAASSPSVAVHQLRPDAQRALASLTGSISATAAPTAGLSPDLAARASEGWGAYQRGDVERAREALAEVAADRAAPAWVRYALGQAEYALGRWEAAAQAWDTVRAAAPEFEPVYFDLADARIQLKDNAAALAVLRAAQKRWPADPEALDAIGVIQVKEGALDAAVDTFKRAVEGAPADGISVFNLAKTYELRYYRSKRYVRMIRQTVANEQDLKHAREWYQKYLELGGPFAASAREGLERLDWAK